RSMPYDSAASAGDETDVHLQQTAVGQVLEVVGEVEFTLFEIRFRGVSDLDVIADPFFHRELQARQLVGRQVEIVAEFRDRRLGERLRAAGQRDERAGAP